MSIQKPSNPKKMDSPVYEILRVSESGVTDMWDWVGTLTVIGSGQYTFLIKQDVFYTASSSVEPFYHSLDKFSEGSELFEFIQSAYCEEHFENLEMKEWLEIILNISKIDEKLAYSVAHSLQEEFDEEPVYVELSIEEKWVEKASWERRKHSGGGAGMARARENLQGKAAILFYVRRYLEQYKELPTGLHHILVTLGYTAEADCPPPHQARQSGVFEHDVHFPER